MIYPVAGESTLKALAAEAAANEARYRARVRTVLRSSYSNHWRRMLSPLLNALELECNNTAYRPVMDAIDLLKRYLDQPIAKEGAFFDEAEKIPLGGVVREEWRKAVVDERGRVERIPYELCVLVSLRDALRRREIWVPGANRWRNPEDDLPPDFEDNRDVHYDAIRRPQDPEKFIEALQKRLRETLTRFNTALELGTTGGVDIVKKHGEPWIKVSPLGKQEEPENLVALKAEIERRWGTIDLIDILKEAEFATGFTGELSQAGRPYRRRCCGADCCWCCSRWGRTWASSGSRSPASTARARPSCAGYGTCSSTGPTCAQRWCGWSTPPSLRAMRRGGARAPPAQATPRSSAPGPRTS